ncbi:hypothetical protein [Streptomyces pactum]|uniref:hypothetical protein n=1 Tax=Streptomyces pactum TaxID=68249 RepID=UPI0036F9AD4E
MTTSVLPAVPGGRPGAAALAALACAGAALLTATPVAAATPGDHGDVKVRSVGTPLSAARDESRVCRFYLLGKDFGAVQEVAYAIFPLGADVKVGGLSGGISLAGGLGRTEELSLPDGRYKLAWHLDGESGQAGQKVFRVDCGDRTAAAPRPSAGQDGPQAAPGGADAAPGAARPQAGARDEDRDEDGTATGTVRPQGRDGTDEDAEGPAGSLPGADGPGTGGTGRAPADEAGTADGAAPRRTTDRAAELTTSDPARAHTDTGAPLNGPVGAGGGGTADGGSGSPATAVLTGTLAAGVAAGAGFHLVRRARRRTHGAA